MNYYLLYFLILLCNDEHNVNLLLHHEECRKHLLDFIKSWIQDCKEVDWFSCIEKNIPRKDRNRMLLFRDFVNQKSTWLKDSKIPVSCLNFLVTLYLLFIDYIIIILVVYN